MKEAMSNSQQFDTMANQQLAGQKRKSESCENDSRPTKMSNRPLLLFDGPRSRKPSKAEAKRMLAKYRDQLNHKIEGLPLSEGLQRVARNVEWRLSQEGLELDPKAKAEVQAHVRPFFKLFSGRAPVFVPT